MTTLSREGELTLTIGAMGLAAQLWAGALPERSTVVGWPADAAHRDTVVGQCLSSGGASLAVGIGASLVAHSWWPLLGVAAIVAYQSGAFLHAASISGEPDIPDTAGRRAVSTTPSGYRWIS